MSFSKAPKVEIHSRLFQLSTRLLHIIPRKGIIARIPGVRKTYIWLSRLFPHEIMVEVQGNKMYIHPADSVLERDFLPLHRTYEQGVTRLFYKLI